MKLIPFLSAAAFLGLGVSAFALSVNSHVLESYAAAASLLVLLGAVRDYSPRRSYWEPRASGTVRFPAAPAGRVDRLAA